MTVQRQRVRARRASADAIMPGSRSRSRARRLRSVQGPPRCNRPLQFRQTATVSGAEKWRQANHPAVLEVATRAATPVHRRLRVRNPVARALAGAAEGRCVPPSRSADKSSSSWCKTVSSVPASQPTRLVACRLRKPRVAVPVRSAPVAARRASGLRSPRHVPRSRHRLRGTKAQGWRQPPPVPGLSPVKNRCRSAIDGPTRRSGPRVQALGPSVQLPPDSPRRS